MPPPRNTTLSPRLILLTLIRQTDCSDGRDGKVSFTFKFKKTNVIFYSPCIIIFMQPYVDNRDVYLVWILFEDMIVPNPNSKFVG